MPPTFPQQLAEMHQVPVSDWPLGARVKNESDGQVANAAYPSLDNCTLVGVPDVNCTVTEVVVPLRGRFGAPATESVTKFAVAVVVVSAAALTAFLLIRLAAICSSVVAEESCGSDAPPHAERSAAAAVSATTALSLWSVEFKVLPPMASDERVQRGHVLVKR